MSLLIGYLFVFIIGIICCKYLTHIKKRRISKIKNSACPTCNGSGKIMNRFFVTWEDYNRNRPYSCEWVSCYRCDGIGQLAISNLL